MKSTDIEVLRIDRWLWRTRFYKTRALALKAIRSGQVRLNGTKAKPASNVRAGDTIEIVKNQLSWFLKAGPLPTRRGPAREAARCFQEDEVSIDRRQRMISNLKTDRLQIPHTGGKPDKRTRRAIRERRRHDS